jgi:hypothetical protein
VSGRPPTAAEVRQRVVTVAAAHGWCEADLPELHTRPEHGEGWGWRVLTTVCGDRAEEQGRMVVFDQEGVGEYGYADLLRRHAAATAGAWRPGEVTEDWVPQSRDEYTVAMEFDGPDGASPERQRWEFTSTGSHWVRWPFLDCVDGYARTHLPGRFVDQMPEDMVGVRLYLPATLVEDVDRALRWPDPDHIVAAIRVAAEAGRGQAVAGFQAGPPRRRGDTSGAQMRHPVVEHGRMNALHPGGVLIPQVLVQLQYRAGLPHLDGGNPRGRQPPTRQQLPQMRSISRVFSELKNDQGS